MKTGNTFAPAECLAESVFIFDLLSQITMLQKEQHRALRVQDHARVMKELSI